MTEQNIIKTIEEYREWEALIAEAKEKLDELKKQLTDELEAREAETMEAGQYIVRNTECSTSRFDTKKFKEALGEELYKVYTKEVKSHRFSIAG